MNMLAKGLAAASLLGFLLGAAPVPEAKVTIDNFSFTPARLTVAKGTKVTFLNHDDIPHQVVAATSPPLWKSPPLDTDDSFARTFDTPGTTAYFCSLHPHMQGTIVVK